MRRRSRGPWAGTEKEEPLCVCHPQKHPEEEITVESLKKLMQEPPPSQEAQEERRLAVLDRFRHTPFAELLSCPSGPPQVSPCPPLSHPRWTCSSETAA